MEIIGFHSESELIDLLQENKEQENYFKKKVNWISMNYQ